MGKCQTRSIIHILIYTFTVWALSACTPPNSTNAEAKDDYFEIASDTVLNVIMNNGVLHNDIGSSVVAELIIEPEHKENFSFNRAGAFSYQVAVETKTVDQFQYQIVATNGTKDVATVTLTTYPAPVVQADFYTLISGTGFFATTEQGVLGNDSSERELVVELIDPPIQFLEFELDEDGAFQYTPLPGFSGKDNFSYRVSDGLQFSDPVNVSLTIQVPKLEADRFSVVSGKALALSGSEGILNNDILGQGSTDVKIIRLPEKAIDFSLDETGQLVYRTVTNKVTTDRFSYSIVTDSQTLGPVDVEISIKQPALSEEPPDAFDECIQYPFTKSVSGTINAAGLENPTFELISKPKLGDLTGFDSTNGQFSYQRLSSARGQDSFSYKVLNTEQQTVAHATMQLIAVPYRVMPIGDSITSGVESNTGSGGTPASNVRVGYRKFLKDKLTAAGYSIDFLGSRSEGKDAGLSDSQHNGYPGEDDSFVGDNVMQWLNRNAADIILMHIGTNGTKSHTNNLTSAANSIDRWEQQNHALTVMQAKIIARADSQASANKVINFNNLIKSFINNRKNSGDRIFEVDQFQVISNATLLSADRLHPRSEGYNLMAEKWKNRLISTNVLRKCD